MPNEMDTSQQPLSYEQEVHATLCTAVVHGEDLLRYFEAELPNTKNDDRRLLGMTIEYVKSDIERAKRVRDQSLAVRNAAHPPITSLSDAAGFAPEEER